MTITAFSLSASDPGPRLLPPSASERLASSYDLILTSMADITIEDEQKEEKEKIEANTLPLQTKLTAIPISSSDESSSDDDEYNSDNAANALRRYGNFTDKSKEEVSKDLEEKIVAVWDFDQTLSLIHVHLMVTLIDGFAKKPAFAAALRTFLEAMCSLLFFLFLLFVHLRLLYLPWT